MVIPNMVMNFSNFEILYTIWEIFDLSSALACRVESKTTNFTYRSCACPH